MQTSDDIAGKPAKSDTFATSYLFWTAAVFLLVLCSQEIDRMFNLWLLLVPLIGIPVVVWAGTLIVAFVFNAAKRRWRRAISIIAAPFLAGFFFFGLGRAGVTPQLVRFELGKTYYLAEAEKLPAANGPRLECWKWGETGGAAVANVFWTLIYDESDTMILPVNSWPAKWAQTAAKILDPCGLYFFVHDPEPGTSVRHLDGHFYVVERVF